MFFLFVFTFIATTSKFRKSNIKSVRLLLSINEALLIFFFYLNFFFLDDKLSFVFDSMRVAIIEK